MIFLRDMLSSYVDAYEDEEFSDEGWFEVLYPVIHDALGVDVLEWGEPILACETSTYAQQLHEQILNASDQQIDAYVAHSERVILL